MSSSVATRPPTTASPPARQPGAQTRARPFGQAALIPVMLFMGIFFVVPVVALAVFSLATQDILTAKVSFGWTLNAWKAMADPIVYRAFGRSLLMSTSATVFCALVGYPLAYFIARYAGRFRGLAFLMVIVPFWVSFVIRAYAWIAILGDQGPVNHFLLWLGVIQHPWQMVYHTPAIVVGIIYGYLPLMVFPVYVALDRIEDSVLEAARDLGATSLSTFWRVTFPQALPGLVAGCIIVWVPATGEYVIPEILGGGKTYMFGNVIAQRFTTIFRWPEGAAFSVALIILMLAVIFLAFRLIGPERLGEAIQ